MQITCINCGETKGKGYNECPGTYDGMGEHEWDETAAELANLTPAEKHQVARAMGLQREPLDYQGE